MFIIRIAEHTDDASIERTELAKRYDKVAYKNATKLMYRRPDNSIRRYWVGDTPDEEAEQVQQIFIMNEKGKTIEIIG